MKKYILVADDPNCTDLYLQYFDDLIGVYQFVCDDLTYDDFDIEDFMAGGSTGYSCVEERIQEHEVSYNLFKNGESDCTFILSGDDGSWEEFTNICFGIKENKIIKFDKFNEGKKDKFPNLKKLEIDGFVVYIGKDAISNDHLTFNIAYPEDIWMHAKGVPGSHVVIRVRENLPTKETIKKVAQLALKNSKSKSDRASVVYCQRKFVKKEKGMNPGEVRVDYTNSEEIAI